MFVQSFTNKQYPPKGSAISLLCSVSSLLSNSAEQMILFFFWIFRRTRNWKWNLQWSSERTCRQHPPRRPQMLRSEAWNTHILFLLKGSLECRIPATEATAPAKRSAAGSSEPAQFALFCNSRSSQNLNKNSKRTKHSCVLQLDAMHSLFQWQVYKETVLY